MAERTWVVRIQAEPGGESVPLWYCLYKICKYLLLVAVLTWLST